MNKGPIATELGVVNRSLEELKKLWKQSPAACVPTASLVESIWYTEHNFKISKYSNWLIMTTSLYDCT